MNQILIAPSILSADFSNLSEDVNGIVSGGCDWLHLDIMDGNFVPNITFGAGLVKSIRPLTNKVFDVHLMVENPDIWLEDFAKAGADYLVVHIETTKHLDRTIDKIKSLGVKAGVALNPTTSEKELEYIIDKLDSILVMTVNPGFGGQEFNSLMINKIMKIKEMIALKQLQNREIIIQVDGGISVDNIADCYKAGANCFVAGSSIFKTKEYGKNIAELRDACIVKKDTINNKTQINT